MRQSPDTQKHTPGPWELDQVSLCIYGWSEDERCIRLADCGAADDDAISEDELEANARLIASAPELLEALKECLKDNLYPVSRQHLRVARAQTLLRLIAKAEGSEVPRV